MKKYLIIIMLLLGICSANAQNFKNDGKPYAFYCKIYRCGSSNDKIGIRWPTYKKDNILYNENGEEIKFNNAIEALNYMSKRGWELDAVTYIEPSREKAYILKKMVTNDEEAKEGLYFTKDFK